MTNLIWITQEAEYVRVVGSVAAVVQALPAHRLVEPVVMLVQASINKLAQALTTQSVSFADPDLCACTDLQLMCLNTLRMIRKPRYCFNWRL